MKKILEFKLDQKAMSMNQVYSTNKKGRRFLVKEGKEYKKIISLLVAKKCKLKDLNRFKTYTCFYSFGFSKGLRKDGEIKKRMYDIDDHIKLLNDAIFETLEVDDSLVTHMHLSKHFDDDYIDVLVVGN